MEDLPIREKFLSERLDIATISTDRSSNSSTFIKVKTRTLVDDWLSLFKMFHSIFSVCFKLAFFHMMK